MSKAPSAHNESLSNKRVDEAISLAKLEKQTQQLKEQ